MGVIEIKCSKAQFDRIIKKMLIGGCIFKNNICVLGKGPNGCPYNKNGLLLNCRECLRKNIKRKEEKNDK